MAVNKGDALKGRDVYIDYPFEDVVFRIQKEDRKIFRAFYGESECVEPIPGDNDLFNQALLSGHEISREEYYKRVAP